MVAATGAVGRSEKPSNALEYHFNNALERLGLDASVRAVLSTSARTVEVSLPVRMDDGSWRIFEGCRVQHSNVRGPYLGGLRISPLVDQEFSASLAKFRSIQAAVMNVPFGGAGGIIGCDATHLSDRELESVARTYASRMHLLMGAYRDVHTTETGTDARVIEWLADECSQDTEFSSAAFTGKSVERGGLEAAQETLGQCIASLVAQVDETGPGSAREVVLRCAGALFSEIALGLSRSEFRVVGISDGCSAIRNGNGIEVEALAEHFRGGGSLSEFNRAQNVDASELAACECDVFISGLGEGALNDREARQIKTQVVVEIAPLETTLAADSVFKQRQITVIPDLVAASGPLVLSYLEWDQNVRQVYCEPERSKRELEASMLRAHGAVKQRAATDKCSLREAAYTLGVERLGRAERLRMT